LRERIFQKYAENLKQICFDCNWETIPDNLKGKAEQLYSCPLCDENFYEFHLNQKHQNSLTLEDVPPVCVGGKPIILTCESCNNEAGSKLDHYLKKYMEFNFLTKGDIEIPVLVNLNKSNTFKSKLIIDKKLKTFKYIIAKKSHYALNKIKEIDKSKEGFNIQTRIKIGNKLKAEKALLRTAHLYAFAKLGYAYSLSLGGKLISSELKNKTHNEIKTLIISENLPMKSEGIYCCEISSTIKLVFVVLKLKLKSNEKLLAVTLPGLTMESVEYYKNCNKNLIVNIETTKIPEEDITKEPYYFLKYFV